MSSIIQATKPTCCAKACRVLLLLALGRTEILSYAAELSSKLSLSAESDFSPSFFLVVDSGFISKI